MCNIHYILSLFPSITIQGASSGQNMFQNGVRDERKTQIQSPNLYYLCVKVYIGNDDMEVEGVWENWYTDEVNRSLWSGNILWFTISWYFERISLKWSKRFLWLGLCHQRFPFFLYLSLISHDKANFVFANLKYHDFHFSQLVEYLPWAPDRPYDGGVKYNCMLVKVFSRHKIL